MQFTACEDDKHICWPPEKSKKKGEKRKKKNERAFSHPHHTHQGWWDLKQLHKRQRKEQQQETHTENQLKIKVKHFCRIPSFGEDEQWSFQSLTWTSYIHVSCVTTGSSGLHPSVSVWAGPEPHWENHAEHQGAAVWTHWCLASGKVTTLISLGDIINFSWSVLECCDAPERYESTKSERHCLCTTAPPPPPPPPCPGISTCSR